MYLIKLYDAIDRLETVIHKKENDYWYVLIGADQVDSWHIMSDSRVSELPDIPLKAVFILEPEYFKKFARVLNV